MDHVHGLNGQVVLKPSKSSKSSAKASSGPNSKAPAQRDSVTPILRHTFTLSQRHNVAPSQRYHVSPAQLLSVAPARPDIEINELVHTFDDGQTEELQNFFEDMSASMAAIERVAEDNAPYHCTIPDGSTAPIPNLAAEARARHAATVRAGAGLKSLMPRV